MVRLAFVLVGLAAWIGIAFLSVRLGRRRQRSGKAAWPCITGGVVTGLVVWYFIAGFAAM